MAELKEQVCGSPMNRISYVEYQTTKNHATSGRTYRRSITKMLFGNNFRILKLIISLKKSPTPINTCVP
jgi:hypothetical protein